MSCALLNRVSGRVASPIIGEFLRRWPTPSSYVDAARKREVVKLIRPLGLYNVRSRRLGRLARSLARGVPYDQIYGVGKYGRDSYLMFVEGRRDVSPDDKELKKYLNGQRKSARKKESE